jgi:hypothetical protein
MGRYIRMREGDDVDLGMREGLGRCKKSVVIIITIRIVDYGEVYCQHTVPLYLLRVYRVQSNSI